MPGLETRIGVSPHSHSRSRSPRGEVAPAAVSRDAISRLIDVLCVPRDAGGFGGSLRYCDLGVLLQKMNCKWDTERIDDCWYDMVRGQPVSVVDSMPWAVQCICAQLHAVPVEFTAEELMLLHKGASSPVQAPHLDRGGTAPFPPVPPAAVRKGDSYTPPAPSQDRPASGRRSHRLGTVRFASPTLSSTRRSRSASELSQTRSTADGSPKRTRSPTNGEVFQRLVEDASNRRRRALFAPPPPPPTTTTTATATAAATVSAATPTVSGVAASATRKGGRSSSSCSNSRRTSTNNPGWSRSTKSFTAKLTPEPARLDRLEAAAATPRVERRTPPGPSAVVPSGYVEAVARLRRFAASRNHHHPFLDSLRAQSPAPAKEEHSPILRLPVPDGGSGRSVIDVRLGTPARSSRLLIPREVPYDDPSRVHIQGVLQGMRSPWRHQQQQQQHHAGLSRNRGYGQYGDLNH